MASIKESTTKRVTAKGSARAPRKPAAEPPRKYFHRDESWLRFNERVLEEACDTTNPLLERVKFLAITASNLDEFLEIRIAGELQRMEEDFGLPQRPDEGGLTPEERLASVRVRLHRFADAQDACWNDQLVPALKAAKIHLRKWKQMTEEERRFAARFYHDQVDPLLTPVTIDPSHPFPRVLNKALCLALLLKNKRRGNGGTRPAVLGVVTVPRSLPRLVALPGPEGFSDFILLHELIEFFFLQKKPAYEIVSCSAFRVTR